MIYLALFSFWVVFDCFFKQFSLSGRTGQITKVTSANRIYNCHCTTEGTERTIWQGPFK